MGLGVMFSPATIDTIGGPVESIHGEQELSGSSGLKAYWQAILLKQPQKRLQ
jgi:hypothetical protein